MVSFQCNDQCHVEYVKINRSRQLALDGLVNTHMDFISNDAGFFGSFLLFSFISYLLLSAIRLLSCILSEEDNLTLGHPF